MTLDPLEAFCEDGRLQLSLLAGRLERDGGASAIGILQRVMALVLGAAQNHVLAETVEIVHLRVLRYLYLVPDAAALFSREHVLSFSRELRDHHVAAVDRMERILGELSAHLDAASAT